METTAGRRFVRPEPDGRFPAVATDMTEQILIIVDGLDNRAEEQRGTARSRAVSRPAFQEVDAGVGRDRPVVMLARTVDAREGLLVEEADEPVTQWRPSA